MNVSIERIKKYNETLKAYNEKGAQLKAELSFNINELNKLCQELSQEIGVEVTTDNIEEVYKNYVSKIEETLRVGEEIFERIRAEEQGTVVQSSKGIESDDAGVVEPMGIGSEDKGNLLGKDFQLPNMFGKGNIKI